MLKMLSRLEGYLICGCLLGMLFCFVALANISTKQQKEWEDFSTAHNCKPVEHRKGTTLVGTTVVKNGVGTTTYTTPDETCYACDDGKRYWREDQ